MAGSLIGSPLHMSPEQIRGEKATQQSDIYSLGVTLYELIAGRTPVNGGTTYELDDGPPERDSYASCRIAAGPPGSAVRRNLRELSKRSRQSASLLPRSFLAPSVPRSPQDISATTAISPEVRSALRPFAKGHHRQGQANLLPASFAPPIQQLVRHLASFIGPIAKVIVARLANQYTDLDRLYIEASKQIENEADRKKFLHTRPPPLQ